MKGGYQRLDVVTDPDIPAVRTVWMFDHTDGTGGNKKLGAWACFGGNVPCPLLKAGTPQEVEDSLSYRRRYCKL